MEDPGQVKLFIFTVQALLKPESKVGRKTHKFQEGLGEAFYAHLQKGSVTVKPGDKVKRGQVIGRLGNSGNTSAPHLHFHIVTGPSVLGSDGVPYVIDHFSLAGQVSVDQFNAASDLTGFWGQDRLNPPSERADQYPLNLNIINFPG